MSERGRRSAGATSVTTGALRLAAITAPVSTGPLGRAPDRRDPAAVGSSRSGWWRQQHRLKHSDATGRLGRLSDHTGHNASERRAGLRNAHCGSRPAVETGKAASGREASDASTDRFRRGIGGGMCGRGGLVATREALPVGAAHANRQPARVRSGRQGGGEVRRYRGSRVMPAEGRDLRWKRWRLGAPGVRHPKLNNEGRGTRVAGGAADRHRGTVAPCRSAGDPARDRGAYRFRRRVYARQRTRGAGHGSWRQRLRRAAGGSLQHRPRATRAPRDSELAARSRGLGSNGTESTVEDSI